MAPQGVVRHQVRHEAEELQPLRGDDSVPRATGPSSWDGLRPIAADLGKPGSAFSLGGRSKPSVVAFSRTPLHTRCTGKDHEQFWPSRR